MAKFNMKDYEDFMVEEKRQDRLQEELEYKRERELFSCGDEYDWRDYQRKQEESTQLYADYEDDDCYCPECDYDVLESLLLDDMLDADVPEFEDGYLNEDDSDGNEECCDDDEYISPDSDELDKLLYLEMGIPEFEGMAAISERIRRKAVARNRHLNKVKAKKSASNTRKLVAEREMRNALRLERKLYKALLKENLEKECVKIFKQLDAVDTSIWHWEKVLKKLQGRNSAVAS